MCEEVWLPHAQKFAATVGELGDMTNGLVVFTAEWQGVDDLPGDDGCLCPVDIAATAELVGAVAQPPAGPSRDYWIVSADD